MPRNKRCTETIKSFGGNDTFTIHKSIQNPPLMRNLVGIILQIEQLEATKTGSTESIFHICLVTFNGKVSGSPVKSFLPEKKDGSLSDDHEKSQDYKDEAPRIFLYLTVIGIDLKLTVFMPHYRTGTVRNGTGIIFIRSRTRIIQNATLLSIYVRKGSTYMSRISVSTTYTAGHKEIFSILRTFQPRLLLEPKQYK